MEAEQLGIAYSVLDLRDKARRTFQDGIVRFAYAPALWESLAGMLLEAGNWQELQAFALQMRGDRSLQDTLAAYSYYLEGRAQLGQIRPNDAAASFKAALAGEYRNLNVALAVANNLATLGYAAMVKDFLARLEKKGAADIAYWQGVYKTAYELKDEDLLLRSASRAHELDPQNVMALNNYAATLLTLRQKPDEAVKITRQLLVQLPGSVAMAYNHGLALLLNQRTQEAEAVLKSVQPDQLKPQENNDYRLAWFELYLQKKQWDLARKSAASVETNNLFASQRNWFEQALKDIP
jgi:predicted Zn-dependent protease